MNLSGILGAMYPEGIKPEEYSTLDAILLLQAKGIIPNGSTGRTLPVLAKIVDVPVSPRRALPERIVLSNNKRRPRVRGKGKGSRNPTKWHSPSGGERPMIRTVLLDAFAKNKEQSTKELVAALRMAGFAVRGKDHGAKVVADNVAALRRRLGCHIERENNIYTFIPGPKVKQPPSEPAQKTLVPPEASVHGILYAFLRAGPQTKSDCLAHLSAKGYSVARPRIVDDAIYGLKKRGWKIESELIDNNVVYALSNDATSAK